MVLDFITHPCEQWREPRFVRVTAAAPGPSIAQRAPDFVTGRSQDYVAAAIAARRAEERAQPMSPEDVEAERVRRAYQDILDQADQRMEEGANRINQRRSGR